MDGKQSRCQNNLLAAPLKNFEGKLFSENFPNFVFSFVRSFVRLLSSFQIKILIEVSDEFLMKIFTLIST